VNKDCGEEFFQELFEEERVCIVIPQCPRSRTKAMMKQKGKVLVEEHVEKLVEKTTTSKVKESQKRM
jgi:hypothetical protein